MDVNVLSIVPIVLTIGLAIGTRNVILSLYTGRSVIIGSDVTQ